MPKEKKYDQATVVKLLSEDSQYAFQIVFDNHRDHIYKVALTYLKSPILAEEVVQDVFFKLWFKRKDLSEIISLEAWLYTVSKNLILNYLKKLSHEWQVRKDWQKQQNSTENSADFKIRNSEFANLFQKALNNLSDQQRIIYTLAKDEQLTYDQIGRRLSISPLTVKTHMSRALASIRLYMQQHGEILVILLACSF